MTDRSPRFVLLLAVTALGGSALSGTALAQEGHLLLDEISVEAVRGTTGNVATSQDSAATSGGGGGPSGVTGYVARLSPSATKTNTPLIETPQSVTVITREQLNDRNVQTLKEALDYAAGTATNVFGFDPRYDSFYVRGFDLTYNGIFRDGLRQVGNNLTLPRVEPYGLEAATILRGPSSGLYGLGSPGGILDLTTKRPVFDRFGEMQLQLGNYDRYQGNLDIGGPVEGSEGTMAYRLTGLRREANSFLPGSPDDRTFIAPAFTWRPSGDTTVTFLGEYQDSKLPGNASFYNAPGFVATKLYSGDPAFNDFKLQQGRIGYALEHRFSQDVIFRQNFRFYDAQNSYQYTQIDAIDDSGTTASRTAGYLKERLSQVALDSQLETHLLMGPVQHTVLSGLDYVHYDFTTRSGFAAAPDLDLTSLNVRRSFIAAPALGARSTQNQDQLGLYLQDQAKLDRLILTLSGRYDWTFQDTTAAGASPGRQDDQAFTGRAGLSYLLAPGLVHYASYATNFTPQLGVDARGRAFKPSTGDQIEAGVKYLIPGTNIQTTVSGFDIVQSSILRPDPTNITATVATGAVRSRGFEMEAVANLAPGTNLTLAYTHLNLRYLRQTSASGQILDGHAVSGIPGDTFTGFLSYLFPANSPLRGLTVGGGLRFTTHSFADDENTVRNPTVTLFDALVAYDFAALNPSYKGFRAQINAYNLFNRDYTNCQAGYCYRGAPATVIGSLIYRW